MKKKRLQNHTLTELAVVPAVILCIVLIVLIHGNPGLTRMAQPAPAFFPLKPDRIGEEPISDYAGVRYVYTFTLPDLSRTGTEDLRLMAFVRHAYASFAVADSDFRVEKTEQVTPHIGRTPGKYWLNIPMQQDFSGKTATLSLTPVFGGLRAEEAEFLLIRRDALLTLMELPQDAPLLVLGLLAVIAGLILTLMVLVIPAEKREKLLVFYIGAVTILAGIWKLSSLPAVLLLLDYLGIEKEIWYGGTVCYLLMLVLSLRMMACMGKSSEGRLETGCSWIAAAGDAVLLALQLAGILELHEAVVWFGIATAAMHLAILLKKKSSPSEWLWMLPFFLTMGADLLINMWTGTTHRACAFLLWTVVNLFVRGFGFAHLAVKRERMLRKKEEELHQSRLANVMSQIQPHFIYNTLSSIYVLCQDDPERAAQVVSDFSDYLQANFTAMASEKLIPFTEELRHTQAYLMVEQALYGEQLSVHFHTDFSAFRLPALTLQPLVENAVKHGIGKGHRPETIRITSTAADRAAVITVEDDGPGFTPAADGSAHIGLNNVRERLAMMCGGEMTIAAREGGGTAVTLWIPLQTEETR